MKHTMQGDRVIAELAGRIDSNSAPILDRELERIAAENEGKELELDAERLEYISSAGLRVLMKLRKRQGRLTVRNVSRDVYEILDVTGFVELLEVRRRLREVSVEGCEMLGKGGNGEVYRLDDETIIKVYNRGTALEKIELEKKYATATFKEGLPCAIAYDTVRVGDRYGIVFELLNAVTMGKLVTANPEGIPEYGRRMAALLRQLHATRMPEGVLPKASDKMLGWIDYIEGRYLAHEDAELLREVVRAVPERDTVLHMDFHEGNVMAQGDELVLIDLDDICTGNRLYELGAYYVSHVLALQGAAEAVEKSTGMCRGDISKMYEATMRAYLGAEDARALEAHGRAMQLFAPFWLIVYLGKGKDSANLTPERAQGALRMVLPQFRQVQPMILELARSYQ